MEIKLKVFKKKEFITFESIINSGRLNEVERNGSLSKEINILKLWDKLKEAEEKY